VSDAPPEPLLRPTLELDGGDIVLVALWGADRSEFLELAEAAGTQILLVDLVEVGPSGVGRAAAEARATVVVLPALVGRWMDPALGAVDVPSLRMVVLAASELDGQSVAGVRAGLAPDVKVVAWAPAGRVRASWEGGGCEDGFGPAVPSSRGNLGPAVPGRDELERAVLALFETVTGVSPVGRTDALVDLDIDGGRAAWFADEAAWRFDVGLRSCELIDHPTVEAVIEVIRSGRGQQRGRPVTASLPSAEPDPRVGGSPLLLLHGLDGSAFSLLPVAAELPAPVVGFESPLLDGRPSPFAELELMALRYLVDIRRLDPEGPYLLGGRGFGGVLAYEIARQIHDEGAHVHGLIVADCGPAARVRYAPPSSGPVGDFRSRARSRSWPWSDRSERRPLPERTAHAVAEHGRLASAYCWPKPSGAGFSVVVGWSPDVGSDDASLGWDSLLGHSAVDIVRFDREEDPAAVGPWVELLRLVVTRLDRR
jgi:hypothetical protein